MQSFISTQQLNMSILFVKKLGLAIVCLNFFILSSQAQTQHDFQSFNSNDGGFNCIFHEEAGGNSDCGTFDLGVPVSIGQDGPVTSQTNYMWMEDIAGDQNPTCFGKTYDLSSLGLTNGDRVRVQYQYAADYGTGDGEVGFSIKGWSDTGGDGMDLQATFSSATFAESGLTFNIADFDVTDAAFPDMSNVVISFCLDSDGASADNTGAYGVMDFYTLFYYKKPTVTFNVVEDCDNNQFTISVDLTDVGTSSGGIDLSDGTQTLSGQGVGMYSFGPYSAGTNVVIQANGAPYGGLNVSSASMTGCFSEIPMLTSGSQTYNLCGGTFVDSGTSGGNYSNNEAGQVTVCPTTSGNLVQVAFSVFNTAANDVLQIYNGNSNAAPSLGSFTGTNSPGTVTSSDGTGCLTFYFSSDGAATGEGWVSEIACVPAVCAINIDNISTVNCSSATYDAQLTVSHSFLGAGNQISITETNSNTTMTFNASGQNGTSIFTLTGLTADSGLENFVASDATDGVCMDSDNTFSAPPNGCAPSEILMGESPLVNTCSGSFYDSGGLENSYQPGESSTTTICPSSAGSLIQVNFILFDIDAQYDGLMIYDGDNTSAPFISSGSTSPGLSACPELVAGAFWGTDNPGTITSSHATGCLTFKFCSEDIIERNGWYATISCVPATCAVSVDNVAAVNCNAGVYDAQVLVNYRFLNAANQIKITEQNSGISMTFPTSGSGGTETFVLSGLVADGNPENFLVADANDINCNAVHTSFVAPSASCVVPITEIIMGEAASPQVICGGTFYDPGGPTGNYAEFESETLTICPSITGAKTKVEFTSFSTENNYDGLMIYDGDSNAAPLISSEQIPSGLACSDLGVGGFFGSNSPGTVISTHSTGCLTFVFCSDVNTQASGWEANISCEDANLPIDLIDFSATMDDKINYLSWSTANEQHTVAHRVERSANGRNHWELIGKVTAAGTTNEVHTYESQDPQPLKVAYYRINTLHTNETIVISPTIVVERMEDPVGILNLAPNPTQDQVHIRLFSTSPQEKIQVTCTNMMGQVVHTNQWTLEEGENNHSIDLGQFGNGIYMLQIDNGEWQAIRRVVKH